MSARVVEGLEIQSARISWEDAVHSLQLGCELPEKTLRDQWMFYGGRPLDGHGFMVPTGC